MLHIKNSRRRRRRRRCRIKLGRRPRIVASNAINHLIPRQLLRVCLTLYSVVPIGRVPRDAAPRRRRRCTHRKRVKTARGRLCVCCKRSGLCRGVSGRDGRRRREEQQEQQQQQQLPVWAHRNCGPLPLESKTTITCAQIIFINNVNVHLLLYFLCVNLTGWDV